MADRIGVSRQLVGQLLDGVEQPGLEIASRIWLAHKIPAHEWYLPPDAGAKAELSFEALPRSERDGTVSKESRAAK
jgi:hypothetical protein